MLIVKLVLGWVFTLAVLAGPYAALCYFFWPFHAVYHGLYWVVALMYLGYGFVTDLNLTDEDLRTAAIPNPFSYADEMARNKIIFTLLMLPAVVMAWTFKVTWVLAFGAKGSPAR